MKKLLFSVILMLSLTSITFAQTIKQPFTQALKTDKDGTKSKWIAVNVTIIFYDELKVDINTGNNDIIEFDIIEATEGKTVSGYGFYQLELEEVNTKERVSLQIFFDEQFGVRLFLHESGASIQYIK